MFSLGLVWFKSEASKKSIVVYVDVTGSLLSLLVCMNVKCQYGKVYIHTFINKKNRTIVANDLINKRQRLFIEIDHVYNSR